MTHMSILLRQTRHNDTDAPYEEANRQKPPLNIPQSSSTARKVPAGTFHVKAWWGWIEAQVQASLPFAASGEACPSGEK
jgi:hypothetical protein